MKILFSHLYLLKDSGRATHQVTKKSLSLTKDSLLVATTKPDSVNSNSAKVLLKIISFHICQ